MTMHCTVPGQTLEAARLLVIANRQHTYKLDSDAGFGVRACNAVSDTTPGQSLGRLLVFEFTCLSVRGEATVLDDDSDCFTLKYTRLYFQCSVSLFPVCLVDVRCGLYYRYGPDLRL